MSPAILKFPLHCATSLHTAGLAYPPKAPLNHGMTPRAHRTENEIPHVEYDRAAHTLIAIVFDCSPRTQLLHSDPAHHNECGTARRCASVFERVLSKVSLWPLWLPNVDHTIIGNMKENKEAVRSAPQFCMFCPVFTDEFYFQPAFYVSHLKSICFVTLFLSRIKSELSSEHQHHTPPYSNWSENGNRTTERNTKRAIENLLESFSNLREGEPWAAVSHIVAKSGGGNIAEKSANEQTKERKHQFEREVSEQ